MTSGLADFVEGHGRALVLVVLSFALAGVVLMFGIPIAIFPQTDFPRVVIMVDNGIAPVDVQMLTVTRPLEEAIRLVPDITDVRSYTSRGGTVINVFFRWDTDIQNDLNLVQGRISQILPTLPAGSRFYVNRLTFEAFPMIGFSMISKKRSAAELYDLAYYQLAPRLYRLQGVAQTRIVGGRLPEMHVVVDPEKLNAYNLPLTKVVDAIRTNNTISASGMVQENHHLYLTTITGLMRTPAQVEDTVVSVVNGTPVTVKDIAKVGPGEMPLYQIVTANGRPAVLVNVYQQPGGNAVEIADAVNRELAEMKKVVPPDVELQTFYDQSILVRESINSVRDSILVGLGLSVIVLLFFLKSWRVTLVAAIVIPVAVLIAVVAMKLFHMSFNLMTLGGIAACIGVVIDDAIVMVENITVHMSLGQSPTEAARSAIVELTPALIGSTLTPIVVFAPLVFLGGITAVFFRALALTLVTALLASLFLAIFFTPVLAKVLLPKRTAASAGSLEEAEQAGEGRIMRRLTAFYEQSLRWSLEHPKAILAAGAALLVGIAGIYYQLGTGFLPEMDEGAFVLDYIMPSGSSLTETDRVLKTIERYLQETPEVESYSRRTGTQLGYESSEPNTGDFLVKLKPKRDRDTDEMVAGLRSRIKSTLPVIDIEFAGILGDLIGDLVSSPEPVEIKIYHPNDDVYKQVAKDVTEWLPKVPGVVDINNRTVVIGPAVNFRVDPVKAERAGFSTQDVADMQAAMLDGQVASNMIRDNRLVGIRVRYPKERRDSMEKLSDLRLTSANGATVPLASVATQEIEEGQTEIRRDNLRNMSAVTARLQGRDLGSAIDEIRTRLPKEIHLPPGTEIEYGGLYQIQRESFLGLTQVALMSILLIFIILVFEFRSFSHPIAILVATILCSFGSLAALLITGTTLNIASFMGAIMVVGIVHKNGILMLDSEKYFTQQGLPLAEAIYQAGRRRLRPILMTALATIFGMLPLAFGVGSGAQLLRPLAIAVIGGVSVSMVLSLLITPVLFYELRRRAS
jgi:CzcA family heavy metal efflux pump